MGKLIDVDTLNNYIERSMKLIDNMGISVDEKIHRTSALMGMYFHLSEMREDEQAVKMREEIKEWEQSFDLFHDAVKRGTEEYREINPEFPLLSLPDTGKMINALCDALVNYKKKCGELPILGKCPSCGEEIQYGLSEKTITLWKNSAFFKKSKK